MTPFDNEEYNMSKRKKSRFGLVLLMVFFIYFAYTAAGQQEALYLKDAELKKVQSKIDEEAKENKKLKEEQQQLDSDEFVEKTAREKLGYVKKDERVYIDIGK
ncbi:MAG: septum formation initiator family protein [Ruminiclostridium sp.]|nr:septum formation initiator family protein [Ruminiclostridium sp.]